MKEFGVYSLAYTSRPIPLRGLRMLDIKKNRIETGRQTTGTERDRETDRHKQRERKREREKGERESVCVCV